MSHASLPLPLPLPPPPLRSDRLLLRRWRDSDEPAMADINHDPEVTRHLNRPLDEAGVRAFYGVVVEHWERHGFGPWAVERIEPDRPGGLIAAALAGDDAIARLGMPRLISVIHPGNGRSQRVAQKLGMTLERLVPNPALGLDTGLWSLHADKPRPGDQRSSGAMVNDGSHSIRAASSAAESSTTAERSTGA